MGSSRWYNWTNPAGWATEIFEYGRRTQRDKNRAGAANRDRVMDNLDKQEEATRLAEMQAQQQARAMMDQRVMAAETEAAAAKVREYAKKSDFGTAKVEIPAENVVSSEEKRKQRRLSGVGGGLEGITL